MLHSNQSVNNIYNKFSIAKYEDFKEKIKGICDGIAIKMEKKKVAGKSVVMEFRNTQFYVCNKYLFYF